MPARTIEIEQWKFPNFFVVTTGDHHRSHDIDAIAQPRARENERFFKSAEALKAEAADRQDSVPCAQIALQSDFGRMRVL